MPDIEPQIAAWRRAMAQASGHRAELLDELEEHLREEIDRLRRTGVSPDKVFETAASKLGAPAPIAAEFDKLHAAPVTWLPVKIARLGLALTALVLAALFPSSLNKSGLLLSTHVVCVTLGYGLAFIIGSLGLCALFAQWFGGFGPSQRQALLRSLRRFAAVSALLTGIGAVLGAVWASDHLGRYWDWDLKETGAFLVLTWTLLIAALRRLRPVPVVFLAILGNPVTAWAWFGAKTGGIPGPFLAAFITAHLLLITGGIVRACIEPRRNSAPHG